MAEKQTYPMLAAKSWWALRGKLASTPKAKITASFLAILLGTTERSAKSDALNYFKQINLIDEDGNPTELAMKWRDDGTYPETCNEIRQNCYPQEIINLFPDSGADIEAVKRWFRNSARVGDTAAAKQARFYLLLTKADLDEAKEVPRRNSNGPAPNTPSKRSQAKPADTEKSVSPQPVPIPPQQPAPQFSKFPSLHVDVQIHIAPDTSPEQIDKIFASMAKHFKDMGGNTSE